MRSYIILAVLVCAAEILGTCSAGCSIGTCSEGCSIEKCSILILSNRTKDELCVSYKYAEKCGKDTIINNAQCQQDMKDKVQGYINYYKNVQDDCSDVVIPTCGDCDVIQCICKIKVDGTMDEFCKTLRDAERCGEDIINNAQCPQNVKHYLEDLKDVSKKQFQQCGDYDVPLN